MWNGKRPKIAVLGGDARSPEAARRLSELGAEVVIAGRLPEVPIPEVRSAGGLDEALQGASAVLFGIHGVSEEGVVHSDQGAKMTIEHEALAGMQPESCLFVGKASNYLKNLTQKQKIEICEYRDRDDFAILNSIPSAEGAVLMAMDMTPITIFGSEALVLGLGRTGATLARTLKALGSRVAVAARKSVDLAKIVAEGFRPVEYSELGVAVDGADLIFNTVPALVLPEPILRRCRPEIAIVDLASAPGGVDFEAAKRLGIKAVLAPGLPGKVAPKSAGRYLAHLIVRHLKATGRPSGELLGDAGGWL